jgi:hypothetical protein
MKKCSKCNVNKSLEEFGLEKRVLDGRTSICTDCRRIYGRENYRKHKEKYKLIYRSKYVPGQDSERGLIYRLSNVAKEKERHLKYRTSEIGKKLRKNAEAKRRAAKLQATPKWANMEKIKQIYLNCPKDYHVDHIIPLKGENASGLHVEHNLQYLPAKENLSKGNRLSKVG